jgi:pimeloyl-ACP methyl ester carboxylesterase
MEIAFERAPAPTRTGPRWLYLHGFASGPGSAKGTRLAEHYAGKGVTLERLDLRQPSMEHLRLSAMIAHVREAIGSPADRAIVFGSSLGGLTAARVAEEDARVCALVLLAPAFRMAERWRSRLGRAEWEKWHTTGYIETKDHARGGMARVDFGFAEDAARVDARGGGWPDVRVPTLVIHGTRDDMVPVEGSRAWAAGKRHVRLVEVDDDHELVASLDLVAREADRHLASFFTAGSPGSEVRLFARSDDRQTQ